jgi:hypothetical protein
MYVTDLKNRNYVPKCINGVSRKNLQVSRVYGLVGYDATLRAEAASYYETTLCRIPGACNFAIAMRTPNLTT